MSNADRRRRYRAKNLEACRASSRIAAAKKRKAFPEYTSWQNMLSRCYNPAHPRFTDYGGRGISVCSRWRRSFVAFREDVGARPSNRHTLDRLNNDGNYMETNCCWATHQQQAEHTRRNLLIDGLPCSVQARRIGMPYSTLRMRIRRGWSNVRALGV